MLPQGSASRSAAVKELTSKRGTFRPDRVKSIAERFGVDSGMVLDNILCARAWSSEQQIDLLTDLAMRYGYIPAHPLCM